MILKNKLVCVVGTGYVGWQLAKAFSRHLKVIGFDIDENKIEKLKKCYNETEIELTNNPLRIKHADFILICVPTPLTELNDPNLKFMRLAAKIVGKNMKKDVIVVVESTCYPGVTEEIIVPILEYESEMKCGIDFKIGYSPERVNPGDEKYNLNKITKIVAGMDAETTEILAELYGLLSKVYLAKDIKTAEAAKLVENIQRDVNIALVNELSLMFHKIGLDTKAVLDAASTKWNFMRFFPGIVGGTCIPVNPYYMIYKANESGYIPQLILCSRRINESMPKYIVDMVIKGMGQAGKALVGSKILIMGLTYKENICDIGGPILNEIVNDLKDLGVDLYGLDPMLKKEELESFGLKSLNGSKVDCVIMTVSHDLFMKMSLDDVKKIMNDKPVMIDIKNVFSMDDAKKEGFFYERL
jgi:UDP-N-acetyl-D-galactosamine dehydrogenase